MGNNRTMSLLFPLVCLIIASSASVAAQEWKKIVPIKSNRAEVEKVLGATTEPYMAFYELEDGKLFIEYSSGPCRADRNGGWNVAENIVVSLHFSPKVKQRVADLKIDRRKFKEEIDKHSNGFVRYYVNEKDGIMYEVQQGEVGYVEYYPPSRYKRLQCGNGPGSLSKRGG